MDPLFQFSSSYPSREVVFDSSKFKFSFADKCKVGRLVVLRSGGFPMTVVDVAGNDLTCQWHNHNGDLCTAKLPKSSLWEVEFKE
jgi:uncharacterized protein YodC (DUF2158 family)